MWTNKQITDPRVNLVLLAKARGQDLETNSKLTGAFFSFFHFGLNFKLLILSFGDKDRSTEDKTSKSDRLENVR